MALPDHLRRLSRTPAAPLSLPEGAAVFAVASGKGGVGKSTVTVNLAVAAAGLGRKVAVVDADIFGFSVPGLLGVTERAGRSGNRIVPVAAHGVSVISMGMFVDPDQAVAWRGPMLHRAVEQFLTDVDYTGIDTVFVDLPPGTGDVAISVGQLLPQSRLVVVTTPQASASAIAERAGRFSAKNDQTVAGVVENMSWMELPGGGRVEVFGSGGGRTVAGALSTALGTDVPLLGQVPLETAVRENADRGVPQVVAEPDSPAAREFTRIAHRLLD